MNSYKTIILASPFLLLGTAVQAGEDVLPLKHGVYLLAGEDCSFAIENGNTSGASMIFTGKKIYPAGGYAGTCDMTKKSVSGNVHTTDEICDTEVDDDGNTGRVKIEQNYVIKSGTEFSISGEVPDEKGEMKKVTEHYQWCAPAPADF
ncbi:hypothetical protein [Castellaniella sp.]|uniref:hypothetical protein n=1 Tax=Castellaniella sp. TaxID=1955812 RepID=UPI002AFEBD25|nr:hypothetical protein [Castellaniella sp.]